MFDLFQGVFLLVIQNKDNTRVIDRCRAIFGSRLEVYEAPGSQKSSNAGNFTKSFMSIIRHNTVDDTARDIAANHIAMIRLAREKGWHSCLFLEDDAEFDKISREKEHRAQSWLSKNQWDMFYLGYCPWPILFSVLTTRDIVRVFSPLTTHAYALSRDGMDKVLMHVEKVGCDKDHIDKLYAQVPLMKRYALFPMVSFQNQDPALYVKACDYLRLSVPFRSLCRTFEWVSVLWPICFLLVFCAWLFFRGVKN